MIGIFDMISDDDFEFEEVDSITTSTRKSALCLAKQKKMKIKSIPLNAKLIFKYCYKTQKRCKILQKSSWNPGKDCKVLKDQLNLANFQLKEVMPKLLEALNREISKKDVIEFFDKTTPVSGICFLKEIPLRNVFKYDGTTERQKAHR